MGERIFGEDKREEGIRYKGIGKYRYKESQKTEEKDKRQKIVGSSSWHFDKSSVTTVAVSKWKKKRLKIKDEREKIKDEPHRHIGHIEKSKN